MTAPEDLPDEPRDAAVDGGPDSRARTPGGGPDPANDWALRGATLVEHRGRRCALLGRWVIVARIASGGMGTVYRAVHRDLGTEAAIKVLHPSLVEGQSGALERFLREARLAAQLRSEHLVAVLDVAQDAASGAHYLVMDFVSGTSARRWAEERGRNGQSVPERTALDIAIAATRGLAVAHAQGVVHRDVKPANILVPADAEGEPSFAEAKLSDLGLARREEGESGLTVTGHGLGTPGYMPPEQAKGAADVGKAADVFAMGATLYALLTGDAPFTGATAYEAIAATVECRFRPLASVRPDVSPATAALVARCLAKRPEDRFGDASELLAAMERVRASLGDASQEAALAEEIAPAAPPPVEPPPRGAADASPEPDAAPAPPPSLRRLVFLAVAGLAVLGGVAAVMARRGPRGGATPDASIPWADAFVDARGPCRIRSAGGDVRTLRDGETYRLAHGDELDTDTSAAQIKVKDDVFDLGPGSVVRAVVPAGLPRELTLVRGAADAYFTEDCEFGVPLDRIVLPDVPEARFRVEITPDGGRQGRPSPRRGSHVRVACTAGAVRLESQTAPQNGAARRLGMRASLTEGTELTVDTAPDAEPAGGVVAVDISTPLSNRARVEVRWQRPGGLSFLAVLDPGVHARYEARAGGPWVENLATSAPDARVQTAIEDKDAKAEEQTLLPGQHSGPPR